MTEFKEGQKVRVLFARGGYNAREGEVLTIIRPTPDGDGDMAARDASGKWRYIQPEQVEALEPEPATPQWSDVEPGDKVTIRVRDTGEELTTTATHRSDAYGQAYNRASVLGLAPGLGLPSNRWELVSIEKPKPQPPTTPGSVVLVHSGSRAWPNGLPLLRQHTGRWIGQNGQSWSDHDVAHANGGTFTVIHDAGAQS